MAELILGTKVILKRKIENPKEGLNYDFNLYTSAGGHQLKYSWKAPDYTCEVPTKIEYIDDETKQKKVAKENYAQDLLNGYPKILELVGEVKQEIVKQPLVQISEAEKLRKELAEAQEQIRKITAEIQKPEVSKEEIPSEPVKKIGRPKKKELHNEEVAV